MEQEYRDAKIKLFAEVNNEMDKPFDEIKRDYDKYLQEVYEDYIADDYNSSLEAFQAPYFDL